MKLRETLLGLVVLGVLLGGAWWARSLRKAPVRPQRHVAAAPATPESPVPEVTLVDGAVDEGDLRVRLSVARPAVAFAKSRYRVRIEAMGASVPLEGGRISFTMEMPMGDHVYDLLPAADGWYEADVVLPTCASGKGTWTATVGGRAAGKNVSARFRVDLAPAASAPPSKPSPS